MAWTAPTVAELKVRFPAFSAVADATVQAALDEAALRVDESWIDEASFRLGRMLYAAHVLTLDQNGSGVAATLGGFRSVTMGPLSITRGGPDSVLVGELASTGYGARFMALLRINQPPVAIV